MFCSTYVIQLPVIVDCPLRKSQVLLSVDTFLQLFSCRIYPYCFTAWIEKTYFSACSSIIPPSNCNRTEMCASACQCDDFWSTVCAPLQELEDVAM